jgi:hypothetical protein
MQSHRIVSREEWVDARKQHLRREKEFTRFRDQLSAERRFGGLASHSAPVDTLTSTADNKRSPNKEATLCQHHNRYSTFTRNHHR